MSYIAILWHPAQWNWPKIASSVSCITRIAYLSVSELGGPLTPVGHRNITSLRRPLGTYENDGGHELIS